MVEKNCWNSWKEIKPVPGDYVYMRDLEDKSGWEVGFCVGDHEVGLLVANDPSYSWLDCDEWQLVPPPGDNWNVGDPPPNSFIYVPDDSCDDWSIGLSIKQETGSKVDLLNSPGGIRKINRWQIVREPD